MHYSISVQLVSPILLEISVMKRSDTQRASGPNASKEVAPSSPWFWGTCISPTGHTDSTSEKSRNNDARFRMWNSYHPFSAANRFIALLTRAGLCAIVLLELLRLAPIVAAQDVLPSQVTPQTLRPPPSGERSLENYGSDNPSMLEGLKRKSGKRKTGPSTKSEGSSDRRPSVRHSPGGRD